jgi:predicted Rossmann-fold nucleotide-binding protein
MLIGSDYWSGLIGWLQDTVAASGKIAARELDLIEVTDDLDLVVERMAAAREAHEREDDPERAPGREVGDR